MRKSFWIASVLGVLFILSFLVGIASSDDGSGCNMNIDDRTNWWNQGYGGHFADCYTPQIYEQNQQIIQLEQQNARIGALGDCISAITVGNGGNPYNFGTNFNFTECEQKVLNDTK